MSKIQIRRDTSTRWGLINPILAAGEIGIDLTTRRFKIGDGTHTWVELEFGAQFVFEKNQPGGYAGIDEETGFIPSEFIDFPDPPVYTNFEYAYDYNSLPEPGQYGVLYLTEAGQFWVWGGAPTPTYRQAAALPDAAPLVKGGIQLTGDLGGTAALPLVKRIGGVAMPVGVPEPGQVIKATTSSTTAWANDNSGGGGGGGGDDERFAHFEQDIGDGTSNPIVVTHMMGTRQIVASMTRKKGDCEVITIFRMKAPSPNYVVIEPDRILESASWRLTLFGSIGLSDVTPPTEPTVAFVSSETDKITVQATSADPDASGFNWFIREAGDLANPVFVGTTTGDTFQYVGLLALTEYEIFATTLDSAGNESILSDPLTETTPTAAPFAYASFPAVPVGTVDVAISAGAGAVRIDGSDDLREAAGTAGNKTYYSLAVLPHDMHTPRFKVGGTNAGLGGSSNRGSGLGLASADGTKAVFIVAAGPGQGYNGRIITWLDGVMTVRSSTSSVSWTSGQTLELIPTVVGGGVVVWTVWKNGVQTSLTWTDNEHAIDLPGTHMAAAFHNIRTANTNYYSPGIGSLSATPV